MAFRRAPDRRRVGETRVWHADPNSLPMLVRSKDSGRTWSEPAIVYTHPFGGSQDPCMVQLSDNSILLASYVWAWMSPETIVKLRQPVSVNLGKFVFLGGYLLRSRDGGRVWDKPILPPHIEPEICLAQHVLNHRQQLRDVVARGELRHDPAERGMDRNLAREALGQDAAPRLEQGHARLVAARFDTQHPHTRLHPSLYSPPAPRLICRSCAGSAGLFFCTRSMANPRSESIINVVIS